MAQNKPKTNQVNSNRHRLKITSNAGQSRISKNFIYSKRDVNEFGFITILYTTNKKQAQDMRVEVAELVFG